MFWKRTFGAVDTRNF